MKNKQSLLNTIAIMSIMVIISSQMAINPILAKLMQAYPTVSTATIRQASTLPSLVAMILALIIGAFVGNKIKFKTVMIMGILYIIIGGVMPIFLNSTFNLILASRVVFGFGIGCFGCRNGLLIRSYDASQRAKMIGLSILIINLSGIGFQQISGILADIKWQYAFYVYLIAVISLVLVIFFMKEPEPVVNTSTDVTQEKTKLAPKVFVYTAILFMSTVFFYPILSGMATFIVEKHLGAATIAGTTLSCYTIGGAITGTFFGKIYKVLNKLSLPVFALIIAIGQAIVLYGNSVPSILIGTTLCGMGYFGINITMATYTGIVSSGKSVALASSIVTASAQFAAFLSTYWITFIGKNFGFIFGTEVKATFTVCMILFALTAIITLIVNPCPKEEKSAAKNQ